MNPVPAMLAAALFALPLLAAPPAAEAHSRVTVHLGAVVIDPPFFGRLHIGAPPPVRAHYHGPRPCRADHRHDLHRHGTWHYDRH